MAESKRAPAAPEGRGLAGRVRQLDVNESGRNTNNWPSFTFEYRRRTRYFDPTQ
jgi:hypothetical protein